MSCGLLAVGMDLTSPACAYVDWEETPSLDFQLYYAHGIGWGNDSTWQSNEIIGKNAHGGGLYNTYRIPFGTNVRVTATLAWDTPNTFWFILRGLENIPTLVGDLELPASARLKLYKNQNVTLQPLQYTTLASTVNSGMLFQVFIEATSADLNFLEACFRAYLDNATVPQFLSSGTEDFFLSAFYFNGGSYESSQSGLTNFNTPSGQPVELSMYKFFWRDPVVWSSALELVWRNMEDSACPSAWPPTASAYHDVRQNPIFDIPAVAPMTYTSYVWTYEWD